MSFLSSNRAIQNDGEERGPLEDDGDAVTLLHGPRRFPHVQLEITFASRDWLDADEDAVHAVGSGGDAAAGGRG